MFNKEYMEDFISKFDSVYKKAEKLGVDPEIVHELIAQVYKLVVIDKALPEIEAYN